jgi:hypothetical protein
VKSTRSLAAELTRQGRRVGADTVADLLREEGVSLQAGARTIEGKQHPDRDSQFRCINERAKAAHGRRPAGDRRGCEEEGTRRRLQERGPPVRCFHPDAAVRWRVSTALTIAVMRLVLQRNFRSRHQLLSAAMACSPTQRILVWLVLWRRCHRRRRPLNGIGTRRGVLRQRAAGHRVAQAVAMGGDAGLYGLAEALPQMEPVSDLQSIRGAAAGAPSA